MIHLPTIDARKAFETLKSDPKALLVCGYESEDEFHQHHLEGAISLGEFTSRKESLSKDRPIIFYCACPHDEAATRQARELHNEFFTNVSILEGGQRAWKEAGLPVMAMAS